MSLSLPRTLVVELLHRAQTAPGAEMTVLRLKDGRLSLRPAPGATAFASYRATAAGTAPTPEEVRRYRAIAPLLLQAALGTRGVLQLRAWDLQVGEARPLDVELAEDAAQGNGNSSVA